jgi:2-polyprenyl-6-methoxyphenol hydroxylase-like FAD-dependent oxidoreductase
VRDVSPSLRTFVTQIAVEPELRERARELGAEVRFGMEMVGFEQDDDGVSALIRACDGGEETRFRARYMVAADGPRSRVRDSPIARVSSSSTRLGTPTIWSPTPGLSATSGDGSSYVQSALGSDEVEVAIEDVTRWECVADVAERFQHGRVFLAGDAAHTMAPTAAAPASRTPTTPPGSWRWSWIDHPVAGILLRRQLATTLGAGDQLVGSLAPGDAPGERPR